MPVESEYKGYPIQVRHDRFRVGDRDHDDVGAARDYIDEELIDSGTAPEQVRALSRLHGEVERGEKLLNHYEVAITIEDDDRGWTYHVGHYQTRNLEDVMGFAERRARMNPAQRRASDMLMKFNRECAEEGYRRLMRGESLDLGEEDSRKRLMEQIRSVLEAGG